MIPKHLTYKKDGVRYWSEIGKVPDHIQILNDLEVEFLYCGHDVQMMQADLANANAENACLKYENDQLKKEIGDKDA